MDSESSLLLLAGSMLLAIWLSGVRASLSDLSWGKIKKLDSQKRKDLVHLSEVLLEGRKGFGLALRFLTLANLVVFIVTAHNFLANQNLFKDHLAGSTLALSTVVITLVFVFVTEILGNGLLASHPWPLLRFSYPVIRVLYFVLYPVVFPTSRLQEHIYELNDPEDEEERSTTADEIISLVEQDAHEEEEESELDDTERRMIRGIFDLDETLVKEIMTPRVDVDALNISSSIPEAKKLIVKCGHSRIPVYSESIDQIVGIVYAKDLLDDERMGDKGELKQFLHIPVFVPETKNIGDLLDEFKQTKKQIAVIIDEYGGTAGLVTIEDILEEIVGEIRDEYDVHEVDALYTVNPEGSVVAEARTPIDDINELLETSIPDDEDYDTIGGYVTSKLGRIPRVNEMVQVDELEVQILAADERKIGRLSLRKLDREEPVTNGKS